MKTQDCFFGGLSQFNALKGCAGRGGPSVQEDLGRGHDLGCIQGVERVIGGSDRGKSHSYGQKDRRSTGNAPDRLGAAEVMGIAGLIHNSWHFG